MTAGHWLMMLLTAGGLGLMTALALWIRPGERGGRAVIRAAGWTVLLFFSGALGGVGISGISVLTVCCLGAPGYALLWAAARL